MTPENREKLTNFKGSGLTEVAFKEVLLQKLDDFNALPFLSHVVVIAFLVISLRKCIKSGAITGRVGLIILYQL